MTLTYTREVQESTAKRRSRFGCRNCKLRKLKVGNPRLSVDGMIADRLSWTTKCDEGKPQCKRCRSFGVLCNFMSNMPDLQPIAADTGRLLPSLTNAVWTSDASTSYELNTKCQDFITRYLGRSLITPDDPNMIQVNRKLLKLAFTVSS
jgi:hypothetical protein